MGKLFDIVKNEVQLTPEVLAIPSMYALWERDKGRGKPTANKEIKYIVFLCDFKSPYKDVPYSEKEQMIREDIFGSRSKWEPDELVMNAISHYYELQKTRTMHLLTSARKAVEKLSEYFDTVDFKQKDDFGKPTHNASDVSRNLKEVGNIVKSLISLEKQVQIEMTELNVRGGAEIGYYENPESVKKRNR